MNVDKIINAVTKALRESSGEQAEVDRFMTSLREQAEASNSKEVKRIVKSLLESEGVDVDEEDLEESKKAKGKNPKKVSETEDEDDDGEELEESKGKKSKKVSETEDEDEVEKKLDELEEAIRQSLGLSKQLVEGEDDEDDEEDLEKKLEEAIRSALGGVGLSESDDPETGDPKETGREGKDYENKMLDDDGQTEDRLKESIQSMVDKSVERIILAGKR